MDEMNNEIFSIFQVESEEIISRLNSNIMDLEKNPNNQEAILLLFRDAHSLKGASRMVGLTSIQTLAHKMEDVLGLAKDKQIRLNTNIVNILYKTVDYLSELITKSIEKGHDVYSENIAKQVSVLEGIGQFSDTLPENKIENENISNSEINMQIFIDNFDVINNEIPKCLYCLIKIESYKDFSKISKMLDSINKLYEIFTKVNYYDFKKLTEDIKVKLEITTRASNTLAPSEVEDLQKILNELMDKIAPIAGLHNLKTVDYYSLAFNMVDEESEQNTVVEQELDTLSTNSNFIEFSNENQQENLSNQEIVDEITTNTELVVNNKLDNIKENISNLVKNFGSINNLNEEILEYIATCPSNDVKSILKKISSILVFAAENEITFTDETAVVIVECIDYCDNIIKNKTDNADKDLIFQRLEIVQQILDYNREKSQVKVFINPKEEKIKKIADFSEVFNTGEIKTLRIDSSKLDTLVSQANELAVAKIKTQKHLQELSNINSDVEDWQKNIIKVLNYLKYYDKKFVQEEDNENSFLARQLLNLFTEENQKVQKLVTNITSLYRNIQEDGLKMNVVIDSMNSMIKNIRVLPLATVFHLFGRMVRDIAQEKNKKIDFEIFGSETTTDKKIIEEIKTPLIHIIRNAIDHGIETPEERSAMGKDPTGKIILAARQVNNKVIIEVKDDGRGIDVKKLKEKALQKGFLTKEEISSMSDEQITNIIFAPGFSTGDEVTNISGRGIGMDVVQSKISQLNGKVWVISEYNKGCCVRIELPATMSLMNAFLVEVSEQTFAVPIESISTVLRKKDSEIIYGSNKRSIIFNDTTIPVYDLADILKLKKIENDQEKRTILIIESNNQIVALCVDKLLGEQEILNKKLSAPFYKLKNISGITTLISGEVCLILNVTDIIKTTNSVKTITKAAPPQKLLNNSISILLVDDSVTTRTLEKNILSTLGYNIITAENPALAFPKLYNQKIDLIISDLEMPEMDGLEFLKFIKSDERLRDIPVVILSSIKEPEKHEKAIKLGAFDYIVKGEFNQEYLKTMVSKVLKNYD